MQIIKPRVQIQDKSTINGTRMFPLANIGSLVLKEKDLNIYA
mgnify:CR=1 FL=1